MIHHMAAIKATPQEIHQWHLDKGWNGFGYNEYIRKNGNVYIGRGDKRGAHTANMNSETYGIGLEGNYDIETEMPKEQFNSLIQRIRYHQSRMPLKPVPMPHSEFFPTSCPGKNFPMVKMYDALHKSEDNINVHWAEPLYNELIGKGYVIHEKRFDDPITRGEVFALLNQK